MSPRMTLSSHKVLWLLIAGCVALTLLLAATGGPVALPMFLAFIVAPFALALTLLNAGKVRCVHCQSRIRRGAAVCRRCGREAAA